MRNKKIYETHVESLLRLLSFRDIETEEHTRPVTTLSLGFARLWDIPEERLLHICWGAHLHDIGKVVIRMHPIFSS